MQPYDNYILGTTSELLELDDSESHQQIALSMATQCQRELDIISRQLDPRVYDTAEFSDALKKMALGSRYAKIRILLLNPEGVIKRGHRLLLLAEKLSSFITIRVPGQEYKSLNESMLIVDHCGFIHSPLSDRYEGQADFNGPTQAEELSRRFNDIWDRSDSHPDLRHMRL